MGIGTHHHDDVATGSGGRAKLRIAGRPKEGQEVSYVILEEPGEPVLMHFRERLVPHFKRGCPHCDGKDEPKPLYYVGAETGTGESVILELTPKCFETAAAAARNVPSGDGKPDLFGTPTVVTTVFRGLLVKISRSNYRFSQRVLRCSQRVKEGNFGRWPYHTREELARVWGIPIRPRIYRESNGA